MSRNTLYRNFFTISSSIHMIELNNKILQHQRVLIKNMSHEGIVHNIKGPDFQNVSSLAVVNCHKNFSPTYLVRYKNI